MPIFEYECNDCSHKFEFLQLNKNEKVNCPKCNGEKVNKMFSVFGFSGGAGRASDDHSSSKCCSCASHKCSTCK
jgi:putative FmdB family regulatory protein